MAVAQRWPAAVTAHVDGLRCPEWSVALSMDPVGDCVDNAVAGSFFATLECWLLDRTTPTTHGAAPAAVFEFIEGWHNTRRRHFELGYHLPRISDFAVVPCPAEQASSLAFLGSDAGNRATEGDTLWVRKNPSPFSSHSTGF